MPIEIVVPDMGESVIEASVARWIKQEGEKVLAGEPVVELETDKVNLEVGAPQAGMLSRVVAGPGATVAVGDVLAYVEPEGTTSTKEDVEAEVKREVAAPEPPAAENNPMTGKPLETNLREEGVAPTPPPTDAPTDKAGNKDNSAQVTPVARRMAEEMGVDLSQVTASGNRITKQDVQAYIESGKSAAPSPERSAAERPTPYQGNEPEAPAAAGSAQPAAGSAQPAAGSTQPAAESTQPAAESTQPAAGTSPATPPAAPRPDETRVRMSRRRQTIARRLVEAQHTAAMLTTFNEIDMSAVMDLRKRRREGFKERFGVDLGFMPFFVKGVVGALKAFPNLNAEILEGPQGSEVLLKHYYDIGIAVGAEEGLVVPVLRGAERLSFAEVEKAIRGFVEKVKTNTLSLDDLRGGTFTITNGGVYGSLLSTPILNPPQVGILGMHRIQERPVVLNGQIVARPMMYVALSYDHRIVDGREAVQFLVRVKELVEDPEALLFS